MMDANGAVAEPPITWCFEVQRYRFRVDTHSRRARALLGLLYGWPSTGDSRKLPIYRLWSESSCQQLAWCLGNTTGSVSECSSFAAALQRLEYEIASQIIAFRSDLIPLHGALVSTRKRSVLITGPSGSGKSTLALALSTCGYSVAGDDVAFLCPTSKMVTPLPRCFHLDQRSKFLLGRLGFHMPRFPSRHDFIGPASLGDHKGPIPPVQDVVHLADRGDLKPARWTMARAELMARLIQETGWGKSCVGDRVAAIAGLVNGVDCWGVRAGELQATIQCVADLLGRPDSD
jgi:hypothetical protein